MHDKTLGITQLIYLQPYYLHIQNAIPTKKRRVSNNYKGKPKDENRATVAPHTTVQTKSNIRYGTEATKKLDKESNKEEERGGRCTSMVTQLGTVQTKRTAQEKSKTPL